MEKLKPTYQLDDVKRLIREKRCNLTFKAKRSAHSLGLSETEAKEFILTLETKDFFKSITEYFNHKVWQDVYKKTHREINLYIKLKISEHKGQYLLILSFKPDTDA